MNEAEHRGPLSAADHKTVNRVESFSDIVFGLSLFNLAFNLRVPANGNELLAQIPSFAVFALTFALLCNLWWLHHRLFREFFNPDGLGIVLNFAFLASVALFTYPLQLYFRFGFEDPVTIGGYAAGSLLVFGLLGAMFAKGVSRFGATLSPERRAAGSGIASRTLIVAAAMLIALCLYPFGGKVMTYPILAAGVVVAIRRILERRGGNQPHH